jgi:hypothetical protein
VQVEAVMRIVGCDAQRGREEAGEVCKGLVKTHHPGGRDGGAKSGPESPGVVGSAMLVTFRYVLTVAVGTCGQVRSESSSRAQVKCVGHRW